jgi:hypothetical protein
MNDDNDNDNDNDNDDNDNHELITIINAHHWR